jgi:hypothetical protein
LASVISRRCTPADVMLHPFWFSLIGKCPTSMVARLESTVRT